MTLGTICAGMILKTGLLASTGKDLAACRHLKNHLKRSLTFVGGLFAFYNIIVAFDIVVSRLGNAMK